MIVVCGLLVMIFALIVVIYCTSAMKSRNAYEYDAVKDLKKRIDELDEDNVTVEDGQKKAKIIVPDIVDPDESTRVSTQNEECKVYEVRPDENIEKKVIGSKKREKDFVNTEIERIEDKEKEDDDPIKENEGFISKILKKNDEE